MRFPIKQWRVQSDRSKRNGWEWNLLRRQWRPPHALLPGKFNAGGHTAGDVEAADQRGFPPVPGQQKLSLDFRRCGW